MRGPGIAVYALPLLFGACAHSDPGGNGDGGEVDAPPGDGADPDATPDAATDGGIDGMPLLQIWRDDTAADFAPGALDRAAIEGYGALTPAAYYTGGLLWRAANDSTFDSGAAATWAEVSALPSTGKLALARSTSLFFAAETPPSVGLTDADSFAMWFEGEVLLDAGTYTFEMLVDDHGFVEVAPSTAAAFQRIASCDWPTAASGNFTAPAAGWYPIRFAGSEGGGEAQIQLRIQGPGIGALSPIPRHRLRTRVSGITGMFHAGFDDGHLLGDVEHTIDQVTPTNTNWNTGNPGDLGLTDAEDWSVRWAGQFRVDAGGLFTFRYVTDDGQRLWVDGVRLLDTWDDMTHDATSGGIDLAPGWHDLVVDQTERGGGAIAALSVATGPELAGQSLPLDRLRPVEGRSERHETGVDRTDRAIPDLNQAPDSAITIAAPTNAVVTGVDVSYSFNHSYWGDLEVRLIAPNGTTALIRPRTGGNTQGTETQRLWRLDLNGAPVAGTWILRVNDLGSSDTGTVLDFQVTPHYLGGEPPIALTGVYESAVRDLGSGIAAFTRVSWVERLPAGANVIVKLRTCDSAAACASEPWGAEVSDPAGGNPGVAARRFAQYRVELSSNGDRPPAVDELSVEYLVNP